MLLQAWRKDSRMTLSPKLFARVKNALVYAVLSRSFEIRLMPQMTIETEAGAILPLHANWNCPKCSIYIGKRLPGAAVR
jgi:hypothetical protein